MELSYVEQNPDMVLVHYLNVPLTDDNKLCLPPLSLQLDSKEWTHDDLITQIRPMCKYTFFILA